MGDPRGKWIVTNAQKIGVVFTTHFHVLTPGMYLPSYPPHKLLTTSWTEFIPCLLWTKPLRRCFLCFSSLWCDFCRFHTDDTLALAYLIAEQIRLIDEWGCHIAGSVIQGRTYMSKWVLKLCIEDAEYTGMKGTAVEKNC